MELDDALSELVRLRENEQRLAGFLSATTDVLYRMSPDWTVMRHLEGRDFMANTEDPSRTWFDTYIDPIDQPRVRAAIEEAIRENRMFQLEHRVRRVDGTLGRALSRASPLTDAE